MNSPLFLTWGIRIAGAAAILIGGFHLTGPIFEPVIAPTVQALREFNPSVIVPQHCTGWKATHLIAREFPEAFVPNSVGTTMISSSTGVGNREQISLAGLAAGNYLARVYGYSGAANPNYTLTVNVAPTGVTGDRFEEIH